MASKDLKFGLVLSVLDRATGPLGKIGDAFGKVGRAGEALQQVGADLRIARENVQDFADRGRAALEGLMRPTQEVESTLLDLRPAIRGWGDDVTDALTRAEQRAVDHARATGQAATEYLAAVGRFARAGHDEAGAHEAATMAMQAASGLRLSAADSAHVLAMTYDQLGDHTRSWHDELANIGDMLVQTRNVYGSFDANTMRDVVKDSAAAAQDARLPLNQLLGLTGALQDAGVQGGAAAGAARGILESIEAASLTAGFALERTADGGLDLARTLAGVQQQIDTAVNPDFARSALADAFGSAWAQVSLLLTDAGRLEQQWADIGAAAGAMADAHAAATQTSTAEIDKMNAEWSALKLELGRGMLPALRELAPALKEVLAPVLEFVRTNPELVATAGTWAVLAVTAAQVASPVLSAASAVTSLAGGALRATGAVGQWVTKAPDFIKSVVKFGGSIKGGIAGLATMGQVIWSALVPAFAAGLKATLAFSAALLANPITWVVAAIVAAAVLIYKYWDPLKDFFSGLWSEIKGAFETGWVDGILKVIELFSPVVWIAKGLDAVTEYLFGFSLFDAGSNIVKTVGEGIVAMASYPVDKMKAVVTKIRNLLPFSPAKEGPLRDLHKVKLVETVAEAVRPDPLVKAMSGAAGLAMAALASPELPPSIGAGSMGGGSGVTMHVTIQLGTGDRGAVQELEAWLRDPANARRLSGAVQAHQAREARAEFA